MRFKLAASAAIALLMLTGATASRAEKSKKKDSGDGSPTMNKQFEWENKVVGPKEGLDKDHVAAIQEQGRREEAQRKKEPPKKQERAKGIAAAGSASLPTMDIEKAATPSAKKTKKVAVAEPRHKDSLDNLLDSEGVKPDNPSGGGTGNDGLSGLLASDDRPAASSSGGKKSSKKHRRRN